jgi:aminoglycoside phosphotransferase (APT) family kinase protein
MPGRVKVASFNLAFCTLWRKTGIMTVRSPHLFADLGTGTPAAQTQISEALVERLLHQQHPDLAQLPVRFVAEGWDNAMFRIGDKLCARLPRRQVAEDLIKLEQRWLGLLAPRLPVPVPVVLRLGVPGCGYPWVWSIIAWMDGEAIGTGRLADGEGAALAHFLVALHRPAPKDAPISACRGGPLSTRADVVAFRAQRLASDFDWIADQILPIWEDALAAPDDAGPVWLHGDLHPANVLMQNGKLSAVIDWGDMCAGDPATDLAALWLLLASPQSRALAIDIYRPTPATLARAKGWAITWGLILLDTGRVDNEVNARIGENILAQVMVG